MKIVKIISTSILHTELFDVSIESRVKYMEKNYGLRYICQGEFQIVDDAKFSYYMLLHSESIKTII